MTVQEAAEYLDYSNGAVCNLCREGTLKGVRRIGNKMWLIPAQSVYEYTKGLQGFAILKAQKDAEKAALMAEIKEAVKAAGKKQSADNDSKPPVETEIVNVDTAADMLNTSKRRIRHYCSWGKIEGARRNGKDWLIPVTSLEAIK